VLLITIAVRLFLDSAREVSEVVVTVHTRRTTNKINHVRAAQCCTEPGADSSDAAM
jgi:hypothetical protein